MKRTLGFLLLIFLQASQVFGSDKLSYTHKYFLYTLDYPSTWHFKELNKITSFYSPLDSPDDKFAENISIVVEDLSKVEEQVTLLDYHRKGMASAASHLRDFKVLEEAKTDFKGREAIIVLYTMTDRGITFKIRALTFMVGQEVYVLTYSATLPGYEKYLKAADNCIRSIRVSP